MDFRHKVSDIIDNMIGLKSETSSSMRKVVFASILKGFLIVAVCLLIGGVLGGAANVNYYNDREYDESTLEDILWEDENLDKLEKAYAENDFDTVRKLLSQNYHVAYNWEHYTAFTLKDEYQKLIEKDSLDEYTLEYVLYFIYYPDYFANTNRMSDSEYQEYQSEKAALIEKMNGFGYNEDELSLIYNTCKDEYGYLSARDLKKMMKEADNG